MCCSSNKCFWIVSSCFLLSLVPICLGCVESLKLSEIVSVSFEFFWCGLVCFELFLVVARSCRVFQVVSTFGCSRKCSSFHVVPSCSRKSRARGRGWKERLVQPAYTPQLPDSLPCSVLMRPAAGSPWARLSQMASLPCPACRIRHGNTEI